MKARKDFVDVTGQRFGALVALHKARGPDGTAGFVCICDCGNRTFVAGGNLRRSTRSCGCAHRAAQLRTCFRHGHARRPEYGVFQTLKQRCSNPQSEKYPDYGGVGIECHFRDFEHFFSHIGPRPTPKHSVDRIDTLGHYEPGNVQWATAKQQSSNRRARRTAHSRDDIFGLLRAPLSFGT